MVCASGTLTLLSLPTHYSMSLAALLLLIPFDRHSSHGHTLHTKSHSNMRILMIFCPRSMTTLFTFIMLHTFVRSWTILVAFLSLQTIKHGSRVGLMCVCLYILY